VTTQSSATEQWIVPELGPSLGRLTDPPEIAPDRGMLEIGFEDIRLDLATRIFDVAGAARSFAATGDRQGAIASLGRVVWIDLWERSVAAAARRIADAVNAQLRDAAAESHLPEGRLTELLLNEEDVRAIGSRLGSGGADFVSALDALEQTVPAASAPGARGRMAQEEWQLALAAAARRLESAWLALSATAKTEQHRWRAEIELVRSWQRPRWPLWMVTVVVLLIVTYLGLVLGGYLPLPGFLRALANLWWSHL
jgi:hypothetical protein